MRNKNYLLLLLLLPFLSPAQKAVLPSGGTAAGNGSISYSVGEITYLTLTGENGSVSSGIQQPFEISVVLEVPEAKAVTLTAYPNPTTDFVLLNSPVPLSDTVYRLFDATGKLISTAKFDGSETRVAMSQLEAAIYFVTISSKEKVLKTFRILKK